MNLHVLDPPVRLESGAQACLVDPGDEEVLVRMLDVEQLVAHGAADDVRVEPEGTDVAANRRRHQPGFCRVDAAGGRAYR